MTLFVFAAAPAYSGAGHSGAKHLKKAERDLRERSKEVIVDVGTRTLSGYDELSFLGWNSGCSAAIEYFSYPPTGENLSGYPDAWRFGTITVPPDGTAEAADWVYRSPNRRNWSRASAAKAVEELLKRGYEFQGHVETVRDAPVAERPGLKRLLLSTATFETSYKVSWPSERSRLYRVHYSPLGTCLFVVFKDSSRPRKSFDYRLIRILKPGVRRERARAHATNGLILYKHSGDIYGSQEELEIAVEMDPAYALARYYRAMLFALHGRYEDCFEQLEEAVRRAPHYAEKAREAAEFETLHDDPRFKAILAIAASE